MPISAGTQELVRCTLIFVGALSFSGALTASWVYALLL